MASKLLVVIGTPQMLIRPSLETIKSTVYLYEHRCTYQFANFLYLFRVEQVYSLKKYPVKYFQKSILGDAYKMASKVFVVIGTPQN